MTLSPRSVGGDALNGLNSTSDEFPGSRGNHSPSAIAPRRGLDVGGLLAVATAHDAEHLATLLAAARA
jgi:hypothetical protein